MRSVAITGFAELPAMKAVEGVTSLGLYCQLAREVAADAGLEREEIDGLLVHTPFDGFSLYWPTVLADTLNLNLGYFDVVELGGASAAGMIWRAGAAIEAGLCNHVLCLTADVFTGLSGARDLMPQQRQEYEMPYGASPPNGYYAMVARRHMHEFDTRPEQLAKIAVDQRTNAMATPGALFGSRALSIDDVLNSPLVCDPLHLYEMVSPCSGGAGVMVSRRSASKSAHLPISLLGAGEAGSHLNVARRPNLTLSWAQQSAAKAFAMAGMTPGDMDFAQLYDCYTIAVLMFIEDLGFCGKGEGGRFVAERDLTWSGDFPCNTSGGQLSYGQPGGAGGMIAVVEAVRQLMGRAGKRQICNAEKGVAHGNGGVLADEVTLIMAN